MDQTASARQVSGKNSNLYSNKNSSTFTPEKRAANQKIETKIDIKIYYHVSTGSFKLQFRNYFVIFYFS